MNTGKKIKDFYCNGFFGRNYDLTDARIEGEGDDWIVVRMTDGSVEIASFMDNGEKEDYIAKWT